MSTAVAQRPAEGREDKMIEYIPFGETKPIKLSLGIVRANIAVPTKSGKHPSDGELVKFMMLCQSRELNPWVGDAYLVGYDSQEGPKFSLITAMQALLKRAEANPNFDGLESGVVVTNKAGELIERQGDLTLPGETLVGAWAKLYRSDRSHPFYDSLKFSTYDTGRSQWKKDPAGMIVKCAQASVLRTAFPSQLGSLYIEQERGAIERRETTGYVESKARVTKIAGLEVKPTNAIEEASNPPTEDSDQGGEYTGQDEAEQAKTPSDSPLAYIEAELQEASRGSDVAAVQAIVTREIEANRWSSQQLDQIDELAKFAKKAIETRKKGKGQRELVS